MSTDHNRILIESLQQVVGERFGRYSKYIIQDRALPDVRDGLKPVQRRILYAMHMEGNTSSKPFRKSAKTVGNVIGNYHPHGDNSVYEAMVRMSQDWKMNIPLVEMHGNNGSIDGDGPAAMRYTEARLSKISALLLENIEKNTVDFIPNFDDTHTEPTVLPARYPNLLVNGSTGISAGYATDIPPHNINEVIDATIHLIKHPNATLEKIMTFIQGPDFPGGGIVQGIDGITKALKTGRGRIIVRGKVEREATKGKQVLVITEIPYEVNKATLVRQMDEIRLNKSIDGITEVRDESDRTGFRIVVEIKKDADVTSIENYFYKNTDLQVNYNYNMVSIYNGRPVLMGAKQMLTAYIEHQLEVLTRRTNYDLKKAKARAHIVTGLIKALSILDAVIATIRGSKNKGDAIQNLMASYDFTEAQADSIVSLQLYRLTNTDVVSLESEAAELETNIAAWELLLSNEENMRTQLIQELKEVNKEQVFPRKSVVEHEVQEIVIEEETLIPKRSGIVTVTHDGYVKFSSQRSYSASNGEDHGHKETDALLAQYEVENTQTIIAITSGGEYLYIPVHTIPEKRWKDIGVHLSTISQYNTADKIIYAFGVNQFVKEHEYLVLTSKNGFIKQVDVGTMKMQRFTKASKVMNLKDDDQVVAAQKITPSKDLKVLIVTRDGFNNFFSLTEVPESGLTAQGVRGIKLGDDDAVATAFVGYDTDSVVLYTDKGTCKRMSLGQLDITGRYRKGNRIIKKMKTQNYEIVGGAEFGMNVNVMFEEVTEQTVIDKMPLADNDTVGKKTFEKEVLAVLPFDIGTIGVEEVEAPSKTIKKTDDATAEFEKMMADLQKEEQGNLFDDE